MGYCIIMWQGPENDFKKGEKRSPGLLCRRLSLVTWHVFFFSPLFWLGRGLAGYRGGLS